MIFFFAGLICLQFAKATIINVPGDQCKFDSDCSEYEVCRGRRIVRSEDSYYTRPMCLRVCNHNDCGSGARCKGENHRAVCFCPTGWEGDPNVQCVNPLTKKECVLPENEEHRKFTRHPCPEYGYCRVFPEESLRHLDLITVKCEPGYLSTGLQTIYSETSLITCYLGEWFPELPECIKLCPRLTSPTVEFTCYQGPRVVSCDKPMLPETVVVFSCKEDYYNNNINQLNNSVTCNSTGEWSGEIPECTPITKTCRVPDPPGHRVFSRYPCTGDSECSLPPGSSLPHSNLTSVTCDSSYFILLGNFFSSRPFYITCQSGEWSPFLPDCVKLCHPLTSLTVKFTCYQGPRVVSCDKPMLPGTVVEFSCKEYYYINDKNQLNGGLTCNSTGDWSAPIPECTPNCGKSNLHSYGIEPTILGDKFSELGNFPWHTGLYHNKNNSWQAVCGGTLISQRLVLTAAHCVTEFCYGCKSIPMLPKDVMVALGKRYRSWETAEKSEAKRAIKEIRVHQDYVGSAVNYGQDIAVLVMESPVQVNNYVMPACVDFSQTYLKRFTENKDLQGYVAGWGNTEECSSFGNVCVNTVSEELKYTTTGIMFYSECFTLSQSLGEGKVSTSRLTSDKFCAGNGTESVVQKGDSGGGMTLMFDGLHHVFGVVSLKLKLEVKDKTFYSFGAFTSVPNYIHWLKTQVYEISLNSTI